MGKSKLVYEILRQQREKRKKRVSASESSSPLKKSSRKSSRKGSSAPLPPIPCPSPPPPPALPADSSSPTAASQDFLDVQVLCDNIGVDHPLQVWADVILQLVDSAHPDPSQRGKRASSSLSGKTAKSRVLTSAEEERNRLLEREQEQKRQKLVNRQRQAWLKSSLEERGLSEHISLLQPLFPEVTLTSNRAQRKRPSAEDRSIQDLDRIEEMLLALLDTLADSHRLVVFLDDAMRMSAESWELLLQVQARITKNLLLILATRPINHVNSPPEVLHPYSQVLRRKPCVIRVSSFPQRVIKRIARSAFSEHGPVDVVPAGLLDLIVKKCRGVPLLVKELIYALKQEGMVRVEQGGVHLVKPKDNQFASEQDCLKHIRDHMPVPDTLQDSLGARIDRLSMPEVLVLKTAAVVGEVFTYSEVWAAFPIPTYKSRISDILRTVMRKGFIKVENLDKRLPGPVGWEATYEFVHSFMRDTLLSRMLENAQQNFLRSRLMKPEVFDSRPFKQYQQEDLGPASIVGPVWIRDKYLDLPQISQTPGADSDDDDYLHAGGLEDARDTLWKPAWLALYRNVVVFWKEREVALLDPDDQDPFHPPQPVQALFLTPDSYVGLAGQIEEDDSDSDSEDEEDEEDEDGALEGDVPPPKNFCLTVKTRGWMREGDWHSDTAQLILVAHSLEQRDQWLRSLGSAIQLAAEDERTRPAAAKTLPHSSAQSRNQEQDLLRNRAEFEACVDRVHLAPKLLEQQLQMQKQTHAMFARQWKKRWITLTDKGLFVRKKQLQPSDPEYLRPQQVAGLAWGQCSCVELRRDTASSSAGGTQWSPNQSRYQNLWQLQLRFEFHMKNGVFHHGPKQFVLGCATEADRMQWVTFINNVIRKHKLEREQFLRDQQLAQQEHAEQLLRRRSSDTASPSKSVPRIVLPIVIQDRFTEWPRLRREYAASSQLRPSVSDLLGLGGPAEGLLKDPQKPLYSPLDLVHAIDAFLHKNPSDLHSQVGSLLHAARNYMVADLSQPPRQTVSLIRRPEAAVVAVAVKKESVPDMLSGFKIRGDIDCWTWNIWDYEDHELSGVCAYLFSRVQYLFEEFSIPSEQLSRFLLLVERRYMDNPYHNFRHALDVVQAVHVMLLQCIPPGPGASHHAHPLAQLRSSLSSMDFLVVLVAALCHDISHPGTDNFYQAKAETPLWKLYGAMEGGLLENHHSVATFTMLAQHPDCNIMQALSPRHQARFREGIHQAIMATDMGLHFKLTEEFQGLLDRISSSGPNLPAAPVPRTPGPSSPNGRLSGSVSLVEFPPEIKVSSLQNSAGFHSSGDLSSAAAPADRNPTISRETRQFLLDMIIHAADISNPTRTWSACKRWCDEILVECRTQGRLEAERGLELGPSNVPGLDQNLFSIKFIDFIVGPLFKECWRLLSPGNPEPQRILHFMRALRDNRSRWEAGLRKEVLRGESYVKQTQEFLKLLPRELEEELPPPPPPTRSRRKTGNRKDRASSRSRRRSRRRKPVSTDSEEEEDSDDVPPPPPPLP